MSTPTPPAVRWAQRSDRLYITIALEDVKNKKLELTEKQLVFSGIGGTDNSPHAVTIDFLKEVVPQESKQLATDREIVMSIKKKEEGPYWSHLLADKTKRHWLKTDFQRWVDEDEDEEEEAGGMGGMGGMGGGRNDNLEEMMAQLGSGFNGGGADDVGMEGDAEDEADSDDDNEELPKLE